MVAPGPPYLWRVQRASAAEGDGAPVLWLFGTIHDLGLPAVPKPVLDALEGATRFASELGDAEADPAVLRELAFVSSGPGIDQTLPQDDWWDLRDLLAGKIKEDALRRARPWYAMILLTKQVAPAAGVSMDVALGKRARSRALPVEGLETWKAQMTALAAVVTVNDLREVLHARASLPCDAGNLAAAYTTGELALMERTLIIARTAETLLWARNRAWQPRLEQLLSDGGGSTFVAVGLGHLLGEHGLPAMLAAAGYRVERWPR